VLTISVRDGPYICFYGDARHDIDSSQSSEYTMFAINIVVPLHASAAAIKLKGVQSSIRARLERGMYISLSGPYSCWQ
jgi:hypothetical protein